MNRGKTLILMYHGLVTDTGSFDQSQVRLTEFERQMRYLKKHYNVVSLGELREMVGSGGVEPFTAVVTFDDRKTDLAALLAATAGTGFPATVIE